jgi:biotin carboxyl carrier protein
MLRESVDLAAESLASPLLRYQAGEVSVLEVVDAQTSARDARNAWTTAGAISRGHRQSADTHGGVLGNEESMAFGSAAAGVLASGCAKKREAEAEAPAPVQVTGVTQEPIRRIVAGDGVLFPLGQSSVMPNISKPVVKFYVNRGDHVKEGQLVATLESRDLKAAVDNAKAQVNQAT